LFWIGESERKKGCLPARMSELARRISIEQDWHSLDDLVY
jgi:hypothetical protein